MSSSFNNNLKVEFLGNTDDVRVLEEVKYYSEGVFPGLVTTLYPGFISDLDSIPEWVKGMVRASRNRYKICYAYHDAWWRLYYYYFTLCPDLTIPPEHILIKEIPYVKGDLLLDEALKVKELGWYPRGKVYYGLRMFGRPGSGDKEADRIKIEKSIVDIKLEKFHNIGTAKIACHEGESC